MAWKVDPKQSKIGFSVKHLMLTTVTGRFTSFEGTLQIDTNDPEASSVEGSVDVASVTTAVAPRDNNLRSAAFFDAKQFPRMSFRSTRVGDWKGDRFKVYGEMTIRGITREVVFDVVNKGEMPATESKRRWGFEASTVVNRKDFDLQWNPLVELGSMAVADDVQATVEIVAVQE